MILSVLVIPLLGAAAITAGIMLLVRWVERRHPRSLAPRPGDASFAAWRQMSTWSRAWRTCLDWIMSSALTVRIVGLWHKRFGKDEAPGATVPLMLRPAAGPASRRRLAADPGADLIAPDEMQAAANAAIPPDWAAVLSRIASHEPEDDAAFVAFMRGETAAMLGLAESWQAQADTCLASIGLDPAAVQGTFELADQVGETAQAVTLATRRFLTVYQEVLAFAANGGVLPHNAREWLTGSI